MLSNDSPEVNNANLEIDTTKRDFTVFVPQDLIGEISSHLDIKSIGSASVVSKAWFTKFTNLENWQHSLFNDYGIKTSWDKNSPLNKKLYQTLQNRWIQQPHLKYLYNNPARHSLMEAIIEDDVDKANRLLPFDESQLWFEWAAHTQAINICKAMISDTTEEGVLRKYFRASALAGSLELVKFSLEHKYSPFHNTILAAIKSGNSKLFELIKDIPEFALIQSDFLREAAAQSGNSQLFDRVDQHISAKHHPLEPDNWTVVEPDNLAVATKKWHLAAVGAGNLLLVARLFEIYPVDEDEVSELYTKALKCGRRLIAKFIHNKHPNITLPTTQDTFNYIVKSANLNWIKDFLASDEGKKVNVKNAIAYIYQSGSLPLVKFILNPASGFNIQPDDQALNCAALSGNLSLVKWLLNAFNLKASNRTQEYAAQSENLDTMMFFLDPENGFTSPLSGMTKHYLDNTNNFALARLYQCHVDFSTSLNLIINGHFQEITKNRLTNAYEAMPYHFYRLTRDALLNPLTKNELIKNQDYSKFEKFLQSIFEIAQLEIHHPDLPSYQWGALFNEVGKQLQDEHPVLAERLFAESRRFPHRDIGKSFNHRA